MSKQTKRKPITLEDLGMDDKELALFARGAKFLFTDEEPEKPEGKPAKTNKPLEGFRS